ncbi:MAG: GlyGly-CTERM sorting domain-containing protein [Gammaproteobacteria bacterium]
MNMKWQTPLWPGLAVLFMAIISLAAQAGINPVLTFHDPDGVVADNFGYSVALSGNGTTALISAFSAPLNEISTGKAYIYSRINGVWSAAPLAVFENPNTTALGVFGWAVALSGDDSVAMITAPNYTPRSTSNYSRVYIYISTNGIWSPTPLAELQNPGLKDGECFGCSVALSADGKTALVGAVATDNSQGYPVGAVYAFKQNNGTWSPKPVAVFSGPAITNYCGEFGYSLALSADGTTALIGDPQGCGPGKVFVYALTNGAWVTTPTVVLESPIPITFDNFGDSVALSSDGTIALIGARHANGTNAGNAYGSAYIFTAASDNWDPLPVAILNDPNAPSDQAAGDFFGGSVALSGDGATAFIGAPGAPVLSNSVSVGKAYVFTQTNGLWSIVPKATFADPEAAENLYLDEFGTSISLSSNGAVALIGTPQTPGLSPPPPNNVPTYGGPGLAYVYESSNGWGNPSPPSGSGGSGGGGAIGWLSLAALLGILLVRRQAMAARCGR